MLLSSRERDFAQNFEPDLSRGVPTPLSQFFNILKIHQKSRKSYFFTKKLPLQGNADTELISLGPKVQFSRIILPLQGNADTELINLSPIQVHMAPFEVSFSQNGSYRVWEASGMPPGLKNSPEIQKIGDIRIRGNSPYFRLLPRFGAVT